MKGSVFFIHTPRPLPWYTALHMSLFGRKEKIAVVFDIGSSSVGGAYVELRPGMKPKIIASVREEMVFQEDLKFERLVSSMQDALGRTGRALHETRMPHLTEKIYACSLSSPWYASQTRIASIRQTEPFLVTEQFISDAVEKEVQDFEKLETPRLGRGVLMEHEAVQVKLNGYETANPLGKRAKEADIAAYVSVIPEKIHLIARQEIGKLFHSPHLRLHSFPFLAFIIIRDIFYEKSFLFLDITGEVTDVSLVRDGVLQETISFPYGKNSLFREVGRELSLSPSEVVSAFFAHQSGDAHEKHAEKVSSALSLAGGKWQNGFDNALSSFSHAGAALPPDIFFTSDGDVSDWFAKQIETEKIYNTSGGEGKYFHIRPMQAPFFADRVEFLSGLVRDPFLSLFALYAGREYNK